MSDRLTERLERLAGDAEVPGAFLRQARSKRLRRRARTAGVATLVLGAVLVAVWIPREAPGGDLPSFLSPSPSSLGVLRGANLDADICCLELERPRRTLADEGAAPTVSIW